MKDYGDPLLGGVHEFNERLSKLFTGTVCVEVWLSLTMGICLFWTFVKLPGEFLWGDISGFMIVLKLDVVAFEPLSRRCVNPRGSYFTVSQRWTWYVWCTPT